MKILFDKASLTAVLTPAMSCVSRKNTFTAVEGVLIETKGSDRVLISTYDLEKGIRAEISAEVSEEGSYIVGAQDFFQYVRVMPGDKILLTVSEKMTANVSCGKTSYTMHALPGKEFPIPPSFEESRGFVIQQTRLKKMIGATAHSIAVLDSNHPELCGACFDVTADGITVAACDSFTLSLCSFEEKMNTEDGGQMTFIVPGRSLSELCGILSDDEEELVTVRLARKHIFFIMSDFYIFSQIIDTKYIDYNRIIPKDMPVEVDISREAFLGSLERASLISEKKGIGSVRSYVKCSFEDSVVHITSNSLSSQIYDEIPCSHKGENIEIGFNCRYLLSCLRAFDAENIKLFLKAPRMSMIIEPRDNNGNEKYMYMILPIKMVD